MRSQASITCPRCENANITATFYHEYHPEVQSWEPPCLDEVEAACQCWQLPDGTTDEAIYELDFEEE